MDWFYEWLKENIKRDETIKRLDAFVFEYYELFGRCSVG